MEVVEGVGRMDIGSQRGYSEQVIAVQLIDLVLEWLYHPAAHVRVHGASRSTSISCTLPCMSV